MVHSGNVTAPCWAVAIESKDWYDTHVNPEPWEGSSDWVEHLPARLAAERRWQIRAGLEQFNLEFFANCCREAEESRLAEYLRALCEDRQLGI